MFRTDWLSIVRILDTLFIEIRTCHTEITSVCVCTLSLNRKTCVVSEILCHVKILLLVGFCYTSISRCTVLRMSEPEILPALLSES